MTLVESGAVVVESGLDDVAGGETEGTLGKSASSTLREFIFWPC